MDGDDAASNLTKSSKPKFNLPLGGLATSKDKSDNMLGKNSGRKGEAAITPSNLSSARGVAGITPSAGRTGSKFGGVRAAG